MGERDADNEQLTSAAEAVSRHAGFHFSIAVTRKSAAYYVMIFHEMAMRGMASAEIITRRKTCFFVLPSAAYIAPAA